MKKLAQEIHRRSLWQVVISYAAVSWVVLEVTGTLVEHLGLPGWVFPSALVLLLAGLPAVLATALFHGRPARTQPADLTGGAKTQTLEPAASSGHRVFNWRNLLLGGAGAFLVLFGFAGLYVVIQDRGRSFVPAEAVAVEPDPAVAFLPFSVTGPALEGVDLGEGMVTLLPMALDGIEGIRAINPMTLWARWKESVPDGGKADLETALRVAEATGSRYAVVGTGVSLGPEVRLAADIYEISGGTLLGHVAVQGSPDSLLQLVDRFAVETVRGIGGVTEGELSRIDLSSVSTRSPDALREYLRGEARYRRADWTAALEHFERAVESDSSFAAAHYRAAIVLGWRAWFQGRDQAARAHYEAALRHTSSERIAIAVRGALAIGSTISETITDDEFQRAYRGLLTGVQQHPEDAELWNGLAEFYFHSHWLGVLTDPLVEAEKAMKRTMELNPDAAPDRIHLVQLPFWDADSLLARERLEDFSRLAPGGEDDRTNRILWRTIFQGPQTPQELEAAVDTLEQFGSVGGIYQLYPVHPTAWPIAEVLIRRRNNRDRSLFDCAWLARSLGAGHLHYYLEEARLEDGPSWVAPYCLVSLYIQGIDAPGLDSVVAASGWPFWNGILAADQGRWGDFEADVGIQRDSASAHLAAGDTLMAAGWENWARVMEGYREWKHGRPDRLVEALEALPLSARFYPSARWWLGLAYLELGRPADAIRMFETFWGWTRWPIAKFHEGEAYEQMGDPERAREAYATFVDAWKDADPELQPWVDRGRAALAGLGPLDQ